MSLSMLMLLVSIQLSSVFISSPSNYCVVQIVASSEQQIDQDQRLVTKDENQTENFIQPDFQEKS